VKVKASGMVPQTKVAPSRSSMAFTLTDESGRFEFDSLPAGQYSLEVNDRRQGYGVAGGLAVLPGSLVSGVAIGLGAVHSVSGKVDLASVSGDQPPRWAYLRFRQAGGGGKEQSARVVRGGEFRARGIPPGSYEVQIFVADESGRPREFVARERVTVVDQDVRGVVLSPMVEPTGNKK
jgi:hypothetical protein